MAQKYYWVSEICWIEKAESFYRVSNDVIQIVEALNEWLKVLPVEEKGFSDELLFFSRHVEGGMTTQKIQDLLLLIRSYQYLLKTNEIGKIILDRQTNLIWEDNILIEIARCNKISIEKINFLSINVLIKKYHDLFGLYSRFIFQALNVIIIKSRNFLQSKAKYPVDHEIVFQLCSSAYKHVENIVPLMTELQERGYTPKALCWHSREGIQKNSGADQVRKNGLIAEELEKWCSLKTIWDSIFKVLWVWNKAKSKKKEFLSIPTLSYQDVNLGPFLWPLVQFLITVELAHSYRYSQSIDKYFKSHLPVAIKLWGGIALKEGYLAWKCVSFNVKPLIFFYSVGVYIDWPYEDPKNEIDLYFVAGRYNKKMVLKSGTVPEANIKICGQARYEKLEEFKQIFNKDNSCIELKIPNTFKLYLFLDTGSILRGFLSIQEQVVITQFLLEFCEEYSSVVLLIKPHPSHKPGILESLIDSYNLENVFLFNQKMAPYHVLNVADILITKYSTLGVEAMLFECPIICYNLDAEKRFQIFEEAADYNDSIESIKTSLMSFLSNHNNLEQWREKHIIKQKEFLDEYFCEQEEAPVVVQSNLITNQLKERAEKHWNNF